MSIKKIKLPRLPTLDSHMLPLSSNSSLHQSRSEERNNGKSGLKAMSIKKTKPPILPTPESHTPPPLFNSSLHLSKSEERSNGKTGLNQWLTMRIKLPISQTLESHMPPPLFNLKEVQKDSPTVWKLRSQSVMILTSSNPSKISQTTSNSFTSLIQQMKIQSLLKSRIPKASHSTSDSESL